MTHTLPQSPLPTARYDLPPNDGAGEILRQAFAGFLPSSAALFHIFDRMETHK